MIPPERIRNFSIVAHIDHGKSTLADRLLEVTKTIDKRLMQSQVLDSMELEREKGITIKANAVRVHYDAADGHTYALNLIDTPATSTSPTRSADRCRPARAPSSSSTRPRESRPRRSPTCTWRWPRTWSIIPVINKIDLASADPEMVMNELEETLAIPREEVILASAKEGTGVREILEAIVRRVPAPRARRERAAGGARLR